MADKRPEWQWNIDWWADRVNNFHPEGSQFAGECPSHADDDMSSLKINDAKTPGTILVNCQAGCDTEIDIVPALESSSPETRVRKVKKGPVTYSSSDKSPDEWWADYTRVEWEFWETLGCEVIGDNIAFTWEDLVVKKIRKKGTKEFVWKPTGKTTPPLWPTIPDQLPQRIYFTEGESDCGILRSVGYETYTITKGTNTSLAPAIYKALQDRGVEEISILFDGDDAGEKAAIRFEKDIQEHSNITPIILDISKIADPFKGEKDIRDIYLKIGDPEQFRTEIESLEFKQAVGRITPIKEFMTKGTTGSYWIVENILLAKTIGMIVGVPKVGKSWMALDLALSISTSTPFMNKFDVKLPGPTLYISKEDPDYLLKNRLAKILSAKGRGGEVEIEKNKVHITFPPDLDPVKFALDLNRDFTFGQEAINNLLKRIRDIEDEYGQPVLIVIDPILRMIPGIDEYRASDVGENIFNLVEEVRMKTGSSVIMVHHTPKGKPSGRNPYGSVVFQAFSDSSLYIQGEEVVLGDWVEVETVFKSEVSGAFKFRFVDLEHEYNVEAEPTELTPKTTKTKPSELILKLIGKSPGITIRELEDITAMSFQGVSNILEGLMNAGDVESKETERKKGQRGPTPNGYFLVDKGLPKDEEE